MPREPESGQDVTGTVRMDIARVEQPPAGPIGTQRGPALAVALDASRDLEASALEAQVEATRACEQRQRLHDIRSLARTPGIDDEALSESTTLNYIMFVGRRLHAPERAWLDQGLSDLRVSDRRELRLYRH